MPATRAPEVACIGQSSRGTAGVYELQLRRKLLQQQLGVVDDRCQRVAKVVAKKHLARLSRPEQPGQRPVPGRDVAHRRQKIITNPGGLPSICVAGVGGGEKIRKQQNIGLTGGRPAATDKAANQERDASQHKQNLLAAAPFKRGGCIDHTRKKQMLQDKQREIEQQAALEKKLRPGRKGLGVRDEVAAAPSAFPDQYLRGEVPCSKHCSAASALVWVCPLEQLDYDHYLPMFFDGIRCLEEPCTTLARQGVSDLLSAARGSPERILPSLPNIMRAIRLAISCKNPGVIIFACSALRQLATGNKEVGEALVPYYKMFLNLFNIFMNSTRSTGDRIDYGQRNNQDIGKAISDTVETLEPLHTHISNVHGVTGDKLDGSAPARPKAGLTSFEGLKKNAVIHHSCVLRYTDVADRHVIGWLYAFVCCIFEFVHFFFVLNWSL
ncbi:unnamed protein product [Pylaiella littoralis]